MLGGDQNVHENITISYSSILPSILKFLLTLQKLAELEEQKKKWTLDILAKKSYFSKMVAETPAVHQQQLADRLVPGCISISAANPVISVGYTLANFQLYATANRIAMPPRAVEPVKPTVIDNYLVQISSAESPNSFYIVREVDMPTRQQLHHKLNGEAANFKVPQSVVPYSLYAVCKPNSEWCKAWL